MRAPRTERCLNCGATLAGRYCSRCGQDAREGDLSIANWLREVADDLLNIDGKILRTLRLLFARPGQLSDEWSAGRRVEFVRPLRLYLAVAVVFFSLGFAIEHGDTFLAGLVDGFAESMGGSQRWELYAERVIEWLPQAMFVLVPISALLSRSVFRRAGRVYLEHFVFVVHLHVVFFLLRTVAYLAPGRWETPVGVAAMLYFLVYSTLAARRFMRVGRWGATVRTVLFLALYGLFITWATLLAGAVYVGITS